jgi:hypothetical protein
MRASSGQALKVRTRNTKGRHLSTPEPTFQDYVIDTPKG